MIRVLVSKNLTLNIKFFLKNPRPIWPAEKKEHLGSNLFSWIATEGEHFFMLAGHLIFFFWLENIRSVFLLR